MNPNAQSDLGGRIIAQAMFSELEKIAYSRAAQNLAQTARGASQQHARVAKATGWKRFVPFTAEHRAADAARVRARQATRAADAKVKAERSAALESIKRGKGNQDAALRLLENKPRRIRPDANPKSGIATPEVTSNRKKKVLTPGVRKAVTGTLGLAGVGGGAVLGKRYLDSQGPPQAHQPVY